MSWVNTPLKTSPASVVPGKNDPPKSYTAPDPLQCKLAPGRKQEDQAQMMKPTKGGKRRCGSDKRLQLESVMRRYSPHPYRHGHPSGL